MAVIRIVTTIAVPIDRCFDLARDIDFHTRSLAGTGERAVAGRITGLIGLGESVTWEARHLGVRQRFTAELTVFERPVYFRDVMTAGAFKSFAHDHRFEDRGVVDPHFADFDRTHDLEFQDQSGCFWLSLNNAFVLGPATN
jgi:hypothetical protein